MEGIMNLKGIQVDNTGVDVSYVLKWINSPS